MIEVEHLVDTLRFFGAGKTVADQFDTVVTLVIVGDLAAIVGMRGVMTRQFWAELQDELRSRGVVDLLTLRRGSRTWYQQDECGRLVIHRGVRFPPPPVEVAP